MGTSLPKIIGITGNIAAGKSTVSKIIRELGQVVVDADQVARDVVLPGTETYDAILARFGHSILDKDLAVDRAKLRSLIYSNNTAKIALERIMHPAIEAHSIKLFQQAARNGHDIVFYDAALLVETGRHKKLGGLLVVVAPDIIRKERLKLRDGLTDDLAQKIMASQLDQNDKIAAATWVIKNEGSESDLKTEVYTWLKNNNS